MPKLRQNIITGEWVVIAPERAKRPEDFVQAAAVKHREPKERCPFCVNGESWKTRIAESKNVYVIPNKYPAFVESETLIKEGDGFYNDMKSVGGHEVIILKDEDHDQDLPVLKTEILQDLLGVYQKRIIHHNSNPLIEYGMVIHNYGPEAGASVEHPHSQFFASPIIPNQIQKEINGSFDYFSREKKCVFCEMLNFEKTKKIRMVAENEHFSAFTFFAARFPFEIWILPKKHEPYFEKNQKIEFLAKIMKVIFSKLDKTLNNPPLNFFVHTAPPKPVAQIKTDVDDFFHWHLEIAPRISKFGGYELGSGLIIDIVSPEKAAAFLNQ